MCQHSFHRHIQNSFVIARIPMTVIKVDPHEFELLFREWESCFKLNDCHLDFMLQSSE